MVVRARQLVALAAATAGGIAAGCGGQAGSPVAAETSSDAACGARVIEDWTDDGRVDDVHRLPCYRLALRALPEDIRSYTSAVDDIERALYSVHPQAAGSSGG